MTTKVTQVDYGVYHQEQPNVCRHCGKPNDAATEVSGRGKPVSGDACLCLTCGELSIYTGDGLNHREPTEAEQVEFKTTRWGDLARGLRTLYLIQHHE